MQRSDLGRPPAVQEQLPVRNQFILMEFRPSLNEPALTLRDRSGHHIDRGNGEHCLFFLIIGVEMSEIMTLDGSENMRIMMP